MNSGELTYGATRYKLVDLGYAPTSAIEPTGAKHGWRIEAHPAAILCRPDHTCSPLKDCDRRHVVALIATKAQRVKVDAVLKRLGLAGGPVCIRSDGSEMRALRYDGFEPDIARSTAPEEVPGDDPALVLEHASRPVEFQPWISSVISLAGVWRGGGSLLEVARSALPPITRSDVTELFDALAQLLRTDAPYVSPQIAPPPAYEWPKFRKRDLVGNAVMLTAHGEAVARGEGTWLPDEPEEQVHRDPRLASLASRLFGGR